MTSTRPPRDFRVQPVELEITPEPTPEERAAIVAALAEPPEPAGPWRDAGDENEPST
jgi:hypothetical protein